MPCYELNQFQIVWILVTFSFFSAVLGLNLETVELLIDTDDFFLKPCVLTLSTEFIF